MDTRLLQAFVLLAETQTYRAAAQRLFITQPALSKQIKTLEKELGLTLFVRGRRGAQLTHAGALLLIKARNLMGQAIMVESLVLAVSRRSRLSQRMVNAPDYRILAAQPFIQLLADKGPGLYRQVEQFIAFNQIKVDIVQQTRDMQTQLALVAAGVGIAIVPASAVHIAPAGINLIPLHGPYADWQVGMVWHPALADPLRELFMALVNTPGNPC